MKKIFLHFLIVLLAGFTFSSCQKCTNCTYIDGLTGEEKSDEFCADGLGSGKRVTDYETEWTEDWANNGGYCRRF